jgi:hypothetical protein
MIHANYMPKHYPRVLPGDKNVMGIAMTKAPTKPPTTIKKTSILASWPLIFCFRPYCQLNFITLSSHYGLQRI